MRRGLSRRELLRVAASVGAGAATPAVARATSRSRPRERKHFVLVHGAWHGAWCWYRIVAALEKAGHRVTTLDLPGGGIDATPPVAVTLQAQADRVIALLDAESDPVVLVGHSAGGPVISTVAEARPQAVERLVYVTAYLLPDGVAIAAVALDDAGSLVSQHLVFDPAGTSTVDPAARREVFYGDCRARDVALAQALLKPMGLRPLIDAVHVGAAFASVRRFYVTCLRDRAISPAAQRGMFTALPCEKVIALASDHSPFLSHPGPLVRALLRLARL